MVAHLQFAQADTQAKNCKRATKLTHKDRQQCTTDKHNRKKQRPITAPWQKSGFCGNIKFSVSNKLLWWLDSFVLLSPLLRQAANRYVQFCEDGICKYKFLAEKEEV